MTDTDTSATTETSDDTDTPTDADSDTAAAEILAKLQQGYDVVKAKAPRRLGRDDVLADDLDLDSLDFIDLVSVLEGEFPPEVLDAVIDRVPELQTVGDLVDTFVAVADA